MEDNPGTSTLVLATPEDIEQVYADASVLGRRPLDEVRVDLPWLTDDERESAARRVRQHHNDCGCRAGELVLALAALSIWLAPDLLDVARPGWPDAALLLVVAAVAGKVLGLALSHRALRNELRRLRSGARTDEWGGGHDGSNPVP